MKKITNTKVYDAIIFDIDGTLWNASQASANGWNVYLDKKKYSFNVTKQDIESVAGKPFGECVRELLSHIDEPMPSLLENLNNHEIEAVKIEGGIFYDGVLELMPKLHQKYRLFLVSNCQEWYMNVFFEKSGLKHLFTDWDCHGRLKRSKAENIKDIIQRNHLKKAVYIGDTLIDKNSSALARIDFIHARYGHQKSVEASISFDSFREIGCHLLKSE